LTRDPEYRVLPSGAEVSSLSLAVNDAVWDSQAREQVVGTVFVQVEVWDVQAAAVAEQLRRGDEVLVLGRLDQREIERRDGTKDRKTRVQALTVTHVRVRHRNPLTGPAAQQEREARDEPVF
jgi:single-strand DNA-binding protein